MRAFSRTFLPALQRTGPAQSHLNVRFFSTPVTASMVKRVREFTGAPMKDCKIALDESGGGSEEEMFEFAKQWLRKKGLATAAKKGGRTAKEGVVALKVDGQRGTLIEMSTETDFSARNANFQQLVADIVHATYDFSATQADGELSLEALGKAPLRAGGPTVGESVTDLVSVIREKIEIKRAAKVSVREGVVAGYTHGVIGEAKGITMGGMAVILGVNSSSGATDKLIELGKKLAMHTVASSPPPLFVRREEVPEAVLQKEKEFLDEQIKANPPKTELAKEKMMEGRVVKFFQENCLMDQEFLIVDDTGKAPKVSAVVSGTAKDVNDANLSVSSFIRYKVGELENDK